MDSTTALDILSTAGPTGILAVLVIGFIRGWLISPGRFDDQVKDKEEWKIAYKTEHEARINEARANNELLELSRLILKILDERRVRS